MKKLVSNLALACALAMSMTAFAQDQMKQDKPMKNDAQPKTMKKDQMKSEKKSKKAAKKDQMKQDSMKHENMKKDEMKKN
jgi:pentapeptide MXKDX repeat protein